MVRVLLTIIHILPLVDTMWRRPLMLNVINRRPWPQLNAIIETIETRIIYVMNRVLSHSWQLKKRNTGAQHFSSSQTHPTHRLQKRLTYSHSQQIIWFNLLNTILSTTTFILPCQCSCFVIFHILYITYIVSIVLLFRSDTCPF